MAQSDFYGYLFETDKAPTKTLDALLRGIANYIQDSVGNIEEKCLTPAKLASFYKAVGGNYDSLFVDVPNPSISWIYTSIGCQHTLQPTPDDDFKPPSIPALTTQGFVRWQSIEILLGPEEHVPFIQTAVKNFAIKNPLTGEAFPVDLPASSFPSVPDKAIEKWHNKCAEKLRQRATPNDTPNDTPTGEDEIRPDLPPRPRARPVFTHVRPDYSRDYFEREPKSRSRPIPYAHVTSNNAGRPVRPKLSHSPSHQARQFLAPEAPPSPYSRGRRRSFPENTSSPSSPHSTQDIAPPETRVPNTRRHSHPRHARRMSVSSGASSSSEDEDPDETPSPKNTHTHDADHIPAAATAATVGAAAGIAAASSDPRRRSHPPHENPPIIRFPDHSPQATPTAAPTPSDPRPRRRISRDRAASVMSEEDDTKRHSYAIPIDLSGKLSAPFLLGNRERSRRNDSRGATVTWKDVTSAPGGEWRRRSRSSDEERDEGRLSRKSSRRSHESGGEKEETGSSGTRRRRGDDVDARPLLRERRYSSHEDVMRRHRHREHEQEREIEVPRASRRRDRRDTSPVRGVHGRKYPTVR